jgi:hypothetical protein
MSKRESVIEKIELERKQIVNIGNITWRQMCLLVDSIPLLIDQKTKLFGQLEAGSEVDDLVWQDREDLKDLQKQIWSIVSDRWEKERSLKNV